MKYGEAKFVNCPTIIRLNGVEVTDFSHSGNTYTDMLRSFGSKRRLIGAYWKNELPAESEKLLEDSIPPEILIGYKPIK